ncbi:MAG: accessory factor UbiK family protein [Alphaproteobacteria bacterium]|nr:accessory factor UbiK family protein [Alphaproteobacteria bacterium]
MPNKSFVEDMITLGSGVLSNLADARHEIKAQAKQRASSLVRDLDLVTREEFDAAFAMLAKARGAQEDIAARLARIEKHLNLSSVKSTIKNKKPSLPSVKTKKTKRARK